MSRPSLPAVKTTAVLAACALAVSLATLSPQSASAGQGQDGQEQDQEQAQCTSGGSSLIQKKQTTARAPQPTEEQEHHIHRPAQDPDANKSDDTDMPSTRSIQAAINANVLPKVSYVIKHAAAITKEGLDGCSLVLRPLLALDNHFALLVLSLLMVMLWHIHDPLVQWWHRPRFERCLAKITEVHKMLGAPSSPSAPPLCPICVKTMPKPPSRHVIVYHCGHSFHVDCSTCWFLTHYPDKPNFCPICELPHSCSATNKDSAGRVAEAAQAEIAADEVKAFFLSSLRSQYPEIITEACVHRWAKCHSETWLEELKCPRYQSFFNSKSQAQIEDTLTE